MKAIIRGFLAGFGFALGASVAGTLIGYAIGRLSESQLKRLISPETSSPDSYSSQQSPTPSESDGGGGEPVEPYQTPFSCGHCDYTSPFRVNVMQHAAEEHPDPIGNASEPPAQAETTEQTTPQTDQHQTD